MHKPQFNRPQNRGYLSYTILYVFLSFTSNKNTVDKKIKLKEANHTMNNKKIYFILTILQKHKPRRYIQYNIQYNLQHPSSPCSNYYKNNNNNNHKNTKPSLYDWMRWDECNRRMIIQEGGSAETVKFKIYATNKKE